MYHMAILLGRLSQNPQGMQTVLNPQKLTEKGPMGMAQKRGTKFGTRN